MNRVLVWATAGLLTALITALMSAPAAWLVPLADHYSDGRIGLAEVEGTLWHGTALIGAAAAGDEAIAALLPGRCAWHISPLALLGRVDIQLENPTLTGESINVHGDWSRWEIGAGSLKLPAEGLSALGAPINTLRPVGLMKIDWSSLSLVHERGAWLLRGHLQIDLVDMASALSPIKPIGAYRLQFDWFGRDANLDLQSLSGPLLIEGRGHIVDGRLKFIGQAWAQAGHEAQLRGVLGLLGQRRQLDDRIVTALEFE
jgi:general secretion pathway protein N